MTKEEAKKYKALNDILANASLTPLFQPIVSMKDQKIYGYEALIRGPSDSPLHSPINLFDAASRYGSLAELDLLCREVSIEKFGQYNLNSKLFINTIPAVLLQDDYQYGHTLDFIKRSGLKTEQIVIELTEQYPIDDYNLMRDATEHYRNMGFSIALDDLGAGYSGLRTWSELEPDFVKIDQHFIQNIHSDEQKRQFVQSMVDIAKGVNCKVISEGIEVREEYLVAQEIKIDFFQGYYFARPNLKPKRQIEKNLFSTREMVSSPSSGFARKNTLPNSLVKNLKPVRPKDQLSLVNERFQCSSETMALPVVKTDGEVVGIVWRHDIMTVCASRYGLELHGRKPVSNFMDITPVLADVSLSLSELSKRITSLDVAPHKNVYIITGNEKYLGVASMVDLLRQITDMQITTARHANPLSGLPGNVPLSEQTTGVIREGADVVVCYFDLDNFKPYNDIYGYSKGDKVLREMSKLLIKYSDEEKDFVGHVGGDDFVVLFGSLDWLQRCQDILEEFTQKLLNYYRDNHLEAKGMSAVDRQGKTNFFPLLCVSIGAVRLLDFDNIKDESDLADYASRAKSSAKKVSGHNIFQLKIAV